MNRSTFMITIIISGVFIISFGSVMAVIMGLVITDSTILGGLLSFAGGAVGALGAYAAAKFQIDNEKKERQKLDNVNLFMVNKEIEILNLSFLREEVKSDLYIPEYSKQYVEILNLGGHAIGVSVELDISEFQEVVNHIKQQEIRKCFKSYSLYYKEERLELKLFQREILGEPKSRPIKSDNTVFKRTSTVIKRNEAYKFYLPNLLLLLIDYKLRSEANFEREPSYFKFPSVRFSVSYTDSKEHKHTKRFQLNLEVKDYNLPLCGSPEESYSIEYIFRELK